jgi:hypothetical protein
MPVPFTFGTATSAIPLSQLDSNFNTAITIGNTAVQLGNTVTTLNSMTLANVTISSVSGPITATQGGTGQTSLTANNVVLGNGTGTVLFVAPGATGNVLVSNGTTWTSNATVANLTATNLLVTEMRETTTVSATAATGTINYDALTQVVLYYTTNASGNFTVNFRGNSGTSLDTVMSTGQSLSATFLVTNGSTAYYNSAVQVDGSSVTPKWQGGTAPTSGNASSIDSYTYVIIKTGSATFTVLASQTKFA